MRLADGSTVRKAIDQLEVSVYQPRLGGRLCHRKPGRSAGGDGLHAVCRVFDVRLSGLRDAVLLRTRSQRPALAIATLTGAFLLGRSGRSGPAGAPAPVAAETASAEQPSGPTEAYARASRVVEDAIALGRWTDADRTALRLELPALRPDERKEILRVLLPAINGQRVRVELDGSSI